jgi:hypothetical protein
MCFFAVPALADGVEAWRDLHALERQRLAKACALESAADEAQISLRDSLRSQTPATQGRDQMQLSILVILAIICVDNKDRFQRSLVAKSSLGPSFSSGRLPVLNDTWLGLLHLSIYR